jgi:hypothetical protein
MEQPKTQYELPWHVYANEPSQTTFHSGYPTEGSAVNAARAADKEAEKLGIKARYIAAPKPF